MDQTQVTEVRGERSVLPTHSKENVCEFDHEISWADSQ